MSVGRANREAGCAGDREAEEHPQAPGGIGREVQTLFLGLQRAVPPECLLRPLLWTPARGPDDFRADLTTGSFASEGSELAEGVSWRRERDSSANLPSGSG